MKIDMPLNNQTKEQYLYYLTQDLEYEGVYIFPKSICPKVNIPARVEFELTTMSQSSTMPWGISSEFIWELNENCIWLKIEYQFWFGLIWLVLWHINHCRSFNTKSFLYIN